MTNVRRVAAPAVRTNTVKDYRVMAEARNGRAIAAESIITTTAAEGVIDESIERSERPPRRQHHEQRPARGNVLVGIIHRQYFWGVVATTPLLLVHVKDPGYRSVLADSTAGHPVGIARAVTPILMTAVGMRLVIATVGIDLSGSLTMVVADAVSMKFLHSCGTPGLMARTKT